MTSPKKNSSRMPLVITIVMLAVSVLFFVLLVDLRSVVAALRAADMRYLAAASAALIAGLAVYAARWWWLLGRLPQWLRTFHAANVGHAVNLLLPFRVGEPARIVVLGRTTPVSVGQGTSSVVVERLLEQVMRLAALGGAVVFGLGLTLSPLTVLGSVAGLVAAGAGILWLRRHREQVLAAWPVQLARLPRVSEARARASLSGLLFGLDQAATPGRLLGALALSALAWACFWMFTALALAALPGTHTAAQTVALSLGVLALAPPSAPSQPGIYHAALVVPLSVLGLDPVMLTAYAVVLHAVLMIWMLGLGVWGWAQSGAGLREVLKAAPATTP
jgi:glycosyltransferase 2 family protein